MSYTQTITTTQTFTMTSAKYIASKIASDLDQVRLFYGNPTEESISKYSLEAAILMKEKCLKNLEYGFKRSSDDKVVFSVKYTVAFDGTITDDGPGRIPSGANVENTYFFSLLEKSDTWSKLTSVEQKSITDSIPVKRDDSPDSSYVNGYWKNDKGYSADGGGVKRGVFTQQ